MNKIVYKRVGIFLSREKSLCAMADASKPSIMKFFSNITPENRAERWLIAHVFVITLLTWWNFAYTQMYVSTGHDLLKLTDALVGASTYGASWAGADIKAKTVLADTFPLTANTDWQNSTAFPYVKSVNNYLHYTCVPIWERVEHEQTFFRLFLLIATAIYFLYALLWVYKAGFKKDTSDLSPFEKRLEVTIWTVTQVMEVVLIAYGFLAFYNLYQNSLTPGLYNKAVFIDKGVSLADVNGEKHITGTAMPKATDLAPASGLSGNTAIAYIPDTSHCFALDKKLGGDYWGKHTPFIWDKLINDCVVMILIFVFTFGRYIVTAQKLFDVSPGVKYGIMDRQDAMANGYATQAVPGVYNIVTMR